MKEEDLSRIKRYPIVEFLERKGVKPVRRTAAYALYCSPLREETIRVLRWTLRRTFG